MELEEKYLKSSYIDTQLGPMLAIGDDDALYLLEFADQSNLEQQIKRICAKSKASIITGNSESIKSISSELKSYFSRQLKEFTTPIKFFGSPFQEIVWKELMQIPYGQTRSYLTQANNIGKKSAVRAVANANGRNQLAIIIPCHRIINSNGNLGGYAGGISRKKWLIDFEKRLGL